MKTKTINELLIILRDNVKPNEDNLIEAGLCNELSILRKYDIITHGEKIRLSHHIDEFKPHYIIPNGLNYIDGNYFSKNGFGWLPTLWQPRLEWLNEQIEITSPTSK